MMDFLEHLPSEEVAEKMISIACKVSSDFVFIAHPSFEDEEYLRSLGLKQFWQDWTGHPTHLMLSQITNALRENGAEAIELSFLDPALDSSHASILPLSAPVDSFSYDPEIHGVKKLVTFNRPVHRQIRIVARFRDGGNLRGSD